MFAGHDSGGGVLRSILVIALAIRPIGRHLA